MYFFNYFMDLEKSPEDVMKDRWYTTNLENIDSILGMSPVNSNSPLEMYVKNAKFKGKKNDYEKSVYTNLSGTDVKKIQREINKQLDMMSKNGGVNKYFYNYNNFTGSSDGYLYNTSTLTKAIKKNKSTNLFTVDKSKLPASFRQSFPTENGEMIEGTAFIQNVVENTNVTQTITEIIDNDAIDMENGI